MWTYNTISVQHINVIEQRQIPIDISTYKDIS